MYSEALRIMDQISMQLMVDEMSQQIEESKINKKEADIHLTGLPLLHFLIKQLQQL